MWDAWLLPAQASLQSHPKELLWRDLDLQGNSLIVSKARGS